MIEGKLAASHWMDSPERGDISPATAWLPASTPPPCRILLLGRIANHAEALDAVTPSQLRFDPVPDPSRPDDGATLEETRVAILDAHIPHAIPLVRRLEKKRVTTILVGDTARLRQLEGVGSGIGLITPVRLRDLILTLQILLEGNGWKPGHRPASRSRSEDR